MTKKPDYTAILVWLPKGQAPTDTDFVQTTEPGSAERWWYRHEAQENAVFQAEYSRHKDSMDPWIRYADPNDDAKFITLNRSQIRAEHSRFLELIRRR